MQPTNSLRFLLFAVWGILSAWSVNVHAASLDLQACLDLARQKASLLQQAEIEVRRQGASLHEAEAARLPSLSAQAVYSKSDDITTQLPDANQAGLHVQQVLLPFGPGWSEATSVAQQLALARLGLSDTAQDLELQVKLAYYSILKAQADLAAIADVSSQTEELKRARPPRFQVGGGPDLDVVKVEATQTDLARQQDLADAGLQDAKRTLARLTGLDPLGITDLAGAPVPPPLPDAVDLSSTVQARMDAARLRLAELDLRASRSALLPMVSASADWGDSGQDWDLMTPGWGVQVSASLPIFEFGRLASVIQKASLALEQQRLAATSAARERADAWASLRDLAASQLRDRDRLRTVLPDLKGAAHSAVRRYLNGGLGILDVTDALGSWLQELQAEDQASYAYLGSLAGLQRLGGSEDTHAR